MIAGPTAALVVYAGSVLWIIRRRRELVYLLLFFFIGATWRLASVAYVDMVGPVPSIELFREIGGGSASVVMVACLCLLFGAAVFAFRRSKMIQLAAVPVGGELSPEEGQALHARVSKAVIVGYSAFLVLLVLDLLRGGVIPLFAGIERYVFSNELAGPFHGILVKYGLHISFVLGMFFTYGELIHGRADRRFLWLLFLTFGYLVLVGNRFSAFYSYGTWFLMTWTVAEIRRRFSAPALAIRAGTAPAPIVATSGTKRIKRLATIMLLAFAMGGMIGYALYRSLVFTRDLVGTEALENVIHRVFVIQGELFTATHERVFEKGIVDREETFNRLFVNPVWDPGRNTTIPYLMELEIGARAYPILDIGSTYTGGYPEIVFELLGPTLGFVGLFAAALVLFLMYRALFRAMIQQRYIRALLLFWMTYLVLMFHAGGMLNTFANWKFLVKLSIIGFWLMYEAGRSRSRTLVMSDAREPA
jgi:hypothetical protein